MILCAHRLVDLGGDGRHLVRGAQHEGVVRVLLGRGVQQLAEEERVLAQPLNLAVERRVLDVGTPGGGLLGPRQASKMLRLR